MSAIRREVKHNCQTCGAKVTYRYDADGASQGFDDKGTHLIPHVCEGRSRHERVERVGTRPIDTK